LNVKTPPYNAKGNGNDDSTAFQAANDYLAAHGGGTILVPTGTYYANFIQDSNVKIKGQGVNVSIIKSVAGSNKDVIQGRNFNTYTGTTNIAAATDGVRYSSIEDITINGNKDNNTSGYGIRIWGCYFYWNNVVVQNCANDNIWTEFSTHGTPSGSNGLFELLESDFNNIKSYNSNGNGWTYNGPHDSRISNYVAVNNAGWALYQRPSRSSLVGYDWNEWLNGNGFYIGTSLSGDNLIASGNTGVGIEFNANANTCRLGNLHVFRPIGIIARGVDNIIKGRIAGCTTTALRFDGVYNTIFDILASNNEILIDNISETAANHIKIRALHATGKTVVIGNILRGDDTIDIVLAGGDSRNIYQIPNKSVLVGGWTPSFPNSNGTLITTDMPPSGSNRGGVLQQSAPTNLSAAPTATDFNNLLSLLKSAGVLA
jgi:hypothetical protein